MMPQDECTGVTIFVAILFLDLLTRCRIGRVVSRNGNNMIWKPTDRVLPARSDCRGMRNLAIPAPIEVAEDTREP
jgi:hypothetical protein